MPVGVGSGRDPPVSERCAGRSCVALLESLSKDAERECSLANSSYSALAEKVCDEERW